MAYLDENGLARFKSKLDDQLDERIEEQSEETSVLLTGKLNTPANVPQGKFLQTNENGEAVWGDGASSSTITTAVNNWLANNVAGGSTIAVDTSLNVTGAAAESKTVGDKLNNQILVQDSQPSSADNKIWVKETPQTEVEVPSYTEFTDLKSALSMETERAIIESADFKIGEYAPYKKWTNAGLDYEINPGIIKINGTSTGGRIINVIGTEAKYANATTPSETQLAYGPFNITQGHKYRLSLKLVAGTVSNANNMYMWIFGTDGTTKIAEIHTNEDVIFTAADSQIGQFCFFTAKNTTWASAVFVYDLTDLTNERTQMSKIAPFYDELNGNNNSGQLCIHGSELYRRVEYGTESSTTEFYSTHWEKTTVAKEFNEKTSALANFYNSINGGVNSVVFEQGSASASSGHLLPSNTTTRIRSRFDCLPFLMRGDIVTVESGFECAVNKVKLDTAGIVNEYGLGWQTGSQAIPEDGLYLLYMQKTVEEGETREAITPSEGAANITVTHPGVQLSTHQSKRELKKNPYERIPWDNVQDVTSLSHAHCTTQEEFDAIKVKYDHIALSNYHPSMPWYPLDKHFQNVGDIIGSPNAEHAYFTGVPSKCHMNAIGSYYSDPTDNPWGGTPDAFIQEAVEGMKMATGGGVTINHPYWSNLTAEKIIDIINSTSGVIALEVWNATCERDNGKGDSSAIWDGILSSGTQIFATAVPDHEAQYHSEGTYGYGYNHMLVANKTEEEVLYAYKTGRFYATLFNDGLTLSEIGIDSDGLVSIEVSEASTYLFKTATRSVEVSTAATSATFQTQDGDVYVRVVATRGSNKLWTNAIML